MAVSTAPTASREIRRRSGRGLRPRSGNPQYFFQEVDWPSGVPALAHMVFDGIEIPGANDLSRILKDRAASFIAAGPPALDVEGERRLRYVVTDLLDDLRGARSEPIASRSDRGCTSSSPTTISGIAGGGRRRARRSRGCCARPTRSSAKGTAAASKRSSRRVSQARSSSCRGAPASERRSAVRGVPRGRAAGVEKSALLR